MKHRPYEEKRCDPEKLGKTTGGTSRRGMRHDIMNHYEEVDEERKGARAILQAVLDTSATMEHQPTDSVHLCDTCAFFTDSSTAWYINQHKSTFTFCFFPGKISLSLSLSFHNMWNRFFWAPCKLLVHIFQLPELPLHLRQRGHFFWDGAEARRMLRSFLPLTSL